ncbi:MAG: hypothetical protein QMD82_03495 [bacterium]|nr:hypothetical protein [bacterium]
MARFKPVEDYSGYFLMIDPASQFEEDSIEKLVNRYVEEKVNIEKFEKNYNNEEKGTRAINPKAILKSLKYYLSLMRTCLSYSPYVVGMEVRSIQNEYMRSADITPTWNDIRNAYMNELAEIPHAALRIFKNMKEIILRR